MNKDAEVASFRAPWLTSTAVAMIIQGRVQGVFFRDTPSRLALRDGVCGWVRNNADGTVEALLEGERGAVVRLVDFCRSGPAGARVDRIDVYEEEPEGLSAFHVR